MTRKERLAIDFAGKSITVVQATNHHNVGVAGKVVDETKFTLRVLTKTGLKRLFKSTISFQVEGLNQVIVGHTIIGRPEERLN